MTERRTGKATLSISALTCAALISGCGALPGSAEASPGPIVVMTWAPEGTDSTNIPGMPAMAQTYATYINAKGGINGRELQVLTCNERSDATAVIHCAQRASDEGAVAVVGSYSQQGSSFTSALEAEGIPYIGGYGITQDEFESPMSYPVNGGLPTLLAGSGRQLARQCAKVSLVRPDTTAGDQFPGFLDAGLHAGNRGNATDLRAAEDATDFTSTAKRAIGDDEPGQCVTAVLGDSTGTFFDSFRRITGTDPYTGEETGPRAKMASVLGSVQQGLVDTTGGKDSPLEGMLLTGWYPTSSDPRWNAMKKVVNTYAFSDNRIDVEDPGVQTTWIAYTVFTKVVKSMGDGTITSTTLKQALDRAHGLSTGGLTPALGWSDQDLVSVADHPRMVNGKITYQAVRNGRLVATGKGFEDMTKILENGGNQGPGE